MSDAPQGPDWWQASDDKWYPPPRPPMPGPMMPGPIMPMQPPPGATPPPVGGTGRGSNRTPLFVALGVLVLVAVGAVIFTQGKDDDPSAKGPTETSTPKDGPGKTTTTEKPEEVNPVKVLDHGFSNYSYAGSAELGESDVVQKAGYGFIIQNTGTEILRHISIDVVLYGAADKELFKADVTLDLLRPGEKFGTGDELGSELAGVPVARMEVVIPYSPEPVVDPAGVPNGGFEVSDIKTEETSAFLETTFNISTTYSIDMISPVSHAIYRNSAGQIVGGASDAGLVDLEGDMAAVGDVGTWSVFPDVATTEIYIDPGLTAPGINGN